MGVRVFKRVVSWVGVPRQLSECLLSGGPTTAEEACWVGVPQQLWECLLSGGRTTRQRVVPRQLRKLLGGKILLSWRLKCAKLKVRRFGDREAWSAKIRWSRSFKCEDSVIAKLEMRKFSNREAWNAKIRWSRSLKCEDSVIAKLEMRRFGNREAWRLYIYVCTAVALARCEDSSLTNMYSMDSGTAGNGELQENSRRSLWLTRGPVLF